jgi:hypothetical protein
VLDELALEVVMFANRAPRREGGGGGGDLAPIVESARLGTGLASGSIECTDDTVSEELLRDRLFPELRN